MSLGLLKNVALGLGSFLAIVEEFGGKKSASRNPKRASQNPTENQPAISTVQRAALEYIKKHDLTVTKKSISDDAKHNLNERMHYILDLIRRYSTDAYVYELASALIKIADIRMRNDGFNPAAAPMSKQEEYRLEVLFDFTKENVRYVHDIGGVDTFQSPPRTIAYGRGDCDDMAILIMAVAIAMGFERARVLAKVIQTQGNPDYNHIYPIIGVRESNSMGSRQKVVWYPLDCTIDWFSFGQEANNNIILKAIVYDVDGKKTILK